MVSFQTKSIIEVYKVRNLLICLLTASIGIVLASCGGRDATDEYTEIEVVEGTAGLGTSGTEGESGPVIIGLGGDTSGELSETGIAPESGLGTDADNLSRRVVYFEYNSSRLTLEAESVVLAHAQNMLSSPEIEVILEGHADERGTREYNLALGEDRAKSVANLMEASGVDLGRLQIVSYGEERPEALGSDETAWSLNRRVEILYQ